VVVGDSVKISVDSMFVGDTAGVVTAIDDTRVEVKLVDGQYAGYFVTVTKAELGAP